MLVGCDGSSLAEEFGNTLKLQHCTISFADRSDMPRWGQLGCQGFIILDGAGSVVCKTTPAFMEVEQLAFRYVEAVIGALLGARPLPRVCPGVMVKIDGLKGAPELNGCEGMCVQAEGIDGRCGISTRAGRIVCVKTSNLTLSAASQQYAPSGGCCGGGCDSRGGKDADCDAGGCDKAGCSKNAGSGSGDSAVLDVALSKLREATKQLREPGEPMPTRMVASLQAREAAAKSELEALVEVCCPLPTHWPWLSALSICSAL